LSITSSHANGIHECWWKSTASIPLPKGFILSQPQRRECFRCPG
jgi:hypothetical protein